MEKVNIREYVEKLKKEDFLRKIQESYFFSRRTVFLSCGDEFRFDDLYSHQKCLCRRAPHVLLQNGGGLQITLDENRRIIFLQDAEEAIINKNIDTVIILSHWLCLVAKKRAMTPDEVLIRTVNAAAIARNYFHKSDQIERKIEVFAHFHVDYEDGLDRTMETYAINEQILTKYGISNQLGQMSYA